VRICEQASRSQAIPCGSGRWKPPCSREALHGRLGGDQLRMASAGNPPARSPRPVRETGVSTLRQTDHLEVASGLACSRGRWLTPDLQSALETGAPLLLWHLEQAPAGTAAQLLDRRCEEPDDQTRALARCSGSDPTRQQAVAGVRRLAGMSGPHGAGSGPSIRLVPICWESAPARMRGPGLAKQGAFSGAVAPGDTRQRPGPLAQTSSALPEGEEIV